MFGVSSSDMIGPPDPARRYTLQQAELAVFHRDMYSLYWDFQTVADISRVLPQDDVVSMKALRVANDVGLSDPNVIHWDLISSWKKGDKPFQRRRLQIGQAAGPRSTERLHGNGNGGWTLPQ